MALGILSIIFYILIIAAIILQVMLYKKQSEKIETFIYWGNVLLALIMSALVYSSLPSNFIVQKVIAGVWGLLAIVGIFIKQRGQSHRLSSKLLLSVSVLGSLIHLIFI